SIVSIPSHISCPVQPLPSPLAERIRHKSLRCHFRSIHIATRQPCSSYVNLPSHSHRDHLHLSVQYVHVRIADRPPNRHSFAPFPFFIQSLSTLLTHHL